MIKLIFKAYKKKTNKSIFFLYIKMTNKCYQKRKEKLQKEARERYQNLFKEQKEQRKKAA